MVSVNSVVYCKGRDELTGWCTSYSAAGVLSAFWVVAGMAVLWVAGSAIQAGYQAGAAPGIGRGDESYWSDYGAD